MHSFKLAAALQHALPNNPNPLLLLVDKKTGHAGRPTQLRYVFGSLAKDFCYLNFNNQPRIKEDAAKWGFVVQSLGLVWKDDAQASSLIVL
jgi:prolyl oligopeptidase